MVRKLREDPKAAGLPQLDKPVHRSKPGRTLPTGSRKELPEDS